MIVDRDNEAKKAPLMNDIERMDDYEYSPETSRSCRWSHCMEEIKSILCLQSLIIIAVSVCCFAIPLSFTTHHPRVPGQVLAFNATHREFFFDTERHYPHLDNSEQTVSDTELCIICACSIVVVCPIIVTLGVIGDLQNFLSASLLAVSTTDLITNAIKNYVGKLRPSFYDQCGWDTSLVLADWDGSSTPCTAEKTEVDDAFESFPSGHASISASALYSVSLYFLHRAHLIAPPFFACFRSANCRRRRRSSVMANKGAPKFLVVLLGGIGPLFAIWIGCSRLVDYRHDTPDVLAGHLLGATLAYSFYTLFFCKTGSTVAED